MTTLPGLRSQTPHSATAEPPTTSNSSGLREATNESEAKPTPGGDDPEVEIYMQLVGRMVYDIVRDWLAQDPEKLAKHQQPHQAETDELDC